MPLTPATTDKFTKVGSPGSATTLSAPGYTTGVSNSIQVGSTTNWQAETKQIFAIDRAQIVNGEEVRIAGSYCEFEGIVTGANTISSLVKRLGTSQNYPSGSLTRVYIPVAATRENDMVDGLNQDHNGKGNHKSLTDDNGNEFLERGQVASAVNQLKVTNAITNTAPRLDAAGDDANVDLYMGAKGTGVAHAENAELYVNFVASGAVIAISAGLIGTFSDAVFYINGKRYKKTTVANKTYTVSKDTYVDIDNTGAVTYNEVANNATAPALAANSIRLARVITSGAAITAIHQTGNDGLTSLIYPRKPGTVYTDANGWRITDHGGRRTYTQRFTWSGSNVMAAWNNFIVGTTPYPVGMRHRNFFRAALEFMPSDRTFSMIERSTTDTIFQWEVSNWGQAGNTLVGVIIDVILTDV